MDEHNEINTTQLPIDKQTCSKVLGLLEDESVSVNVLEAAISKDPAIVLAIFQEGIQSQTLTSSKGSLDIKDAIVSIGQTRLKELLEEFTVSLSPVPDEYETWVKIIKHKCGKCSDVAQIIAMRCNRSVTTQVKAIGLLAYTPELHALIKLKDRYTALLENGYGKAKLRYKLSQEHKFDFDHEAKKFYKSVGLGEKTISLLDYDSSLSDEELLLKKAILLSAIEFVDAFLEDRIENLSAEKAIPPKSSRRLLGLTKENYRGLYEAVSDYLKSGKLEEFSLSEEEVVEEEAEEDTVETVKEGASSTESEIDKTVPIAPQEPQVAPPALRQKKTKVTEQTLNKIIGLFEGAEEVQELLLSLLDMLIKDGPFKRTALLVVSPEERRAAPLLFRGEETEVITELTIDNPLSPLLNLQSKVVSCSRKKSDISPFGCGTYAMAPLEVNYDSPVVLYADCGDGTVINFEARRLFRRSVTLLNQMLPDMDGTISAEGRTTKNTEPETTNGAAG